MRLRGLVSCAAIAAALGAQGALGQSAKNPFQSQINAEAAARAAADATLFGAIHDEAEARKAAIDELRASIGRETSIVGRYAFTGTQVCTNSARGFDANLSPLFTQDSPNFVSTSTATVSGVREFKADGTGTVQATFHGIGHPGVLVGFVGSVGGGGISVTVLSSSFTWHVADGELIIQDDGAPGTIVSPPPRAGWTAATENLPQSVARLGKDLRIFSLTHKDMGVETSVVTSLDGQVFRTPRICNRERSLRKL